MGNFSSYSRDRGRSSGRDFGGRDRDRGGFRGGDRGRGRGGFDRDRKPLEMHTVICDKCKKECEVPFKPTGDKPVYCRDCFSKNDSSRSSSGSSGISAEQFNQLNAKLDKIIALLESLEIEESAEEE